MEAVLPFMVNLVVLIFALGGIGLGIAVALHGMGFVRSGIARAIASPILLVFGVWMLYLMVRRVA